PVWVTDPRTVADGLRLIRELGEVTGTRQRAEEILRQLEPLYERVRAAAAGRAPVAVFYAIWRDPYMTVGADTYVHDMLTVCGGRNVFGDRPERYPTVTLDEVAARRPAVILLRDETEDREEGERDERAEQVEQRCHGASGHSTSLDF